MSQSSSSQPWGYGFNRVKSTGTVNYDSFNGDIEFNINASESERWISPKNSYLSIKLRIIQTDETGTAGLLAPIVNTGVSKAAATLVSVPYIAPNPAAALFSAVSCNIGEENISNNQNIAQSNTLYRSLYESKLEQDTVNSTNPIKYMSLADTDITANKSAVLSEYFGSAPNTGYPNNLANLSNRKLFALKNMMGFNKYNEIEIQTQLLAPLMYSDDLIPPNTPLSLRYTVDPMYYLNLIQIVGSNISSFPVAPATPTNFTIGKLTSANSNAGSLNNISVGIVDMNLWLYQVHMPNVVGIPKEIYIKQFTSTLHAITQGTHDEFVFDCKKNRRITHIACAFVQKKGSIKTSPTDFSSGYYIGANNAGVDTPNAAATTEAKVYSNSPIDQLLNIRIEYAGSVYPFQPYTLNFDTTGATSSGSTYRSFYDFVNYSDGLRDRNGTLLTSDQWIVTPIILFKTFQAPDNDDNSCLISLDFKQSISGCNIFVCAYYDEVLSLAYDSYGKYQSFSVY